MKNKKNERPSIIRISLTETHIFILNVSSKATYKFATLATEIILKSNSGIQL